MSKTSKFQIRASRRLRRAFWSSSEKKAAGEAGALTKIAQPAADKAVSFVMGLPTGDVKAATKSLEKDDLIEAEEALFRQRGRRVCRQLAKICRNVHFRISSLGLEAGLTRSRTRLQARKGLGGAERSTIRTKAVAFTSHASRANQIQRQRRPKACSPTGTSGRRERAAKARTGRRS